ncbi:hypothetical protein OIV83_002304 [Microbotryomycetes sp. JL201]|nr:hypothetical protein OIV83_002304 [Microbotryomycetes sp. JL201]
MADPGRAQRLVEQDAYEPRGVDMYTGQATHARASLDDDDATLTSTRGVLFDARHSSDDDVEDPWHLNGDDDDEDGGTNRRARGRRRRSSASASSMSSSALGRHARNDDDDDGLAWEPSMSASELGKHTSSGSANGGTTRQQRSYSASQRPFHPLGHHNATADGRTSGQRRQHGAGGSIASQSGGGPLSSLSDLDKRTKQALWWRTAMINCLFIAAWYTFSTCISVYNKWMFSSDHYDFPFPLFVTSCHMLVQWTLAGLTLSFFKNLRPTARPKASDYAKSVAPCGVATGLDIGLSNLSLRSITLSFYTMCKSSSLAFVLVFAFLFRLEVPTWKLVGIIAIITAGVILMVSTETQFDFAGMVEVLTASALGGLRWSLTQILLDKEALGMNNPIATLFWLAPMMGLTLATCSMLWDGWWTVFADERFFGSFWATLSTLGAILFPGVLAFCMNVTEFGSVAGIFKEVGTIFLSMFIFHDQLTPINVSGLVITICGIGMYNYLKYRQFIKDPEAASRGHGASIRRQSHAHTSLLSSNNEESYDEDAPMLTTGDVARKANGRADDAMSLATLSRKDRSLQDDDGLDGPLHQLGSDDSLSSFEPSDHSSPEFRTPMRNQRIGSVSLPSQSRTPFTQGPSHHVGQDGQGSNLHLEAQTLESKIHQHDNDKVGGLQSRMYDDTTSEGQKLIQLDKEQQELNDLLSLDSPRPSVGGQAKGSQHSRTTSLLMQGTPDLMGQVDKAIEEGERQFWELSKGKKD